MSPWWCSHSGLSRLDMSSMPADRSTSVMVKRALRCTALWPPPLPSSSTSCTGTAVDVHRDPDRLDHPLLRGPDGAGRAVSWDEAMAWTGRRLQAVIDEHGPAAVSAYIGNPTAFNALATLHLGALLYSIGVRRTFS